MQTIELPPIATAARSLKQPVKSAHANMHVQGAMCHGKVALSANSNWLHQGTMYTASASAVSLMTINQLVACLAPHIPCAGKRSALQELCRRASTAEKPSIETYLNLHPYAINHMLELLTTADVVLRAPAATALTKLLRPTPELQKRVGSWPGVISALVAMLAEPCLEVQVVAAAAIIWTAQDNRANQEAVVKHPGAAAALLALLRSTDAGMSKSSAAIVACLVHGNAKTAELLGQCDEAAPALVALLSSPNTTVRREAAWAIRSFVEGNTANQERVGQQHGAIERLLEQERRKDGLYAKLALRALVQNHPNNIRRKLASQTGFTWISS